MGFATRHQPRKWSSTSKIVGPGITIFQGPNSYEPKREVFDSPAVLIEHE